MKVELKLFYYVLLTIVLKISINMTQKEIVVVRVGPRLTPLSKASY